MYFSIFGHINIHNGCLNLDSKELLRILTPKLNGYYFYLAQKWKTI